MASTKKRLDVLLVERGLAESRQRAQAIIMSGQVYVGEQKVDKAGTQLPEDAEVAAGMIAYLKERQLEVEEVSDDVLTGSH